MTVQLSNAFYDALAGRWAGVNLLKEKNMNGFLKVVEVIREAVLAGKLPGSSLNDVVQVGVECANQVDELKRSLAVAVDENLSLRAEIGVVRQLNEVMRAQRPTEESRRLDALKAKLQVFSFVGMCNEPGTGSSLEELGTLVKITSRGDTKIRLGVGPIAGENHQLKDGEEVYFAIMKEALGGPRVVAGNVAQAQIDAANARIQDLEQKLQTQKNRSQLMAERAAKIEDKHSRLKATLRDLGFDRARFEVAKSMPHKPYSPFPGGVEPLKGDCQGEAGQ